MDNIPHYRYITIVTETHVKPHLQVYATLRETPCGYWIVPEFYRHYPEVLRKDYKKWVSKTSVRRYCYPTKEEAWESYQIRNSRRIAHLKYQLMQAESAALFVDENSKVKLPSEYSFDPNDWL